MTHLNLLECGLATRNGAVTVTTLFVAFFNFLRPHLASHSRPPVPLPELKTISTLQDRWNKILEMALASSTCLTVGQLGPGFVDDVQRCLADAAEAAKPGRGNNLPNTCLARLRTQAQSDFLRP